MKGWQRRLEWNVGGQFVKVSHNNSGNRSVYGVEERLCKGEGGKLEC